LASSPFFSTGLPPVRLTMPLEPGLHSFKKTGLIQWSPTDFGLSSLSLILSMAHRRAAWAVRHLAISAEEAQRAVALALARRLILTDGSEPPHSVALNKGLGEG
jgi:hypothetical protein